MKTITVAVADVDDERRRGYERLLRGEAGITLLSNVEPGDAHKDRHAFENRRRKQRTDVLPFENEVARIKRLQPLVMLVSLDLSDDESHAWLLLLRSECPRTHIVLLTDESVRENALIQALEIGARGYITNDAVGLHLSRAVQVVGRGEAWIPRKMLDSILKKVLHVNRVLH